MGITFPENRLNISCLFYHGHQIMVNLYKEDGHWKILILTEVNHHFQGWVGNQLLFGFVESRL